MIGLLRASVVRSLDPERSLDAHQRYLGLRVVGHERAVPAASFFGIYGLPETGPADIWRLRARDDELAERWLIHAPGGRPRQHPRVHSWDLGPLATSWRAEGVAVAWEELAQSPYRPWSARPVAFDFVGSASRFHEILVDGPDHAGWALMETLTDQPAPRPQALRLFVNTNCFPDAEEALAIYRDLMGLQVRTEYTRHNPGQGGVFNLPPGEAGYSFYALRAPEGMETNRLGINFMVFHNVPDQRDLRDECGPEFEGHLADSYVCRDVNGFAARLAASPHAFRLRAGPLDLPGDPFGRRRALSFRGPGGNLIEIASYDG